MKDDYMMKAGDPFDHRVAVLINQAWDLLIDSRWMFRTDKDFFRAVYDSTALSVTMENMYREGGTDED